jgi:manganese/zinc/iron transport system ATP- binding protein
MVVHHDLSSVADYFDSVLLMNRTVIAFGPTADVFTGEHLQRAYGGKLAVLPGGQLIAAQGRP